MSSSEVFSYNQLHTVAYRGGWIGLFAGENQTKALKSNPTAQRRRSTRSGCRARSLEHLDAYWNSFALTSDSGLRRSRSECLANHRTESLTTFFAVHIECGGRIEYYSSQSAISLPSGVYCLFASWAAFRGFLKRLDRFADEIP